MVFSAVIRIAWMARPVQISVAVGTEAAPVARRSPSRRRRAPLGGVFGIALGFAALVAGCAPGAVVGLDGEGNAEEGDFKRDDAEPPADGGVGLGPSDGAAGDAALPEAPAECDGLAPQDCDGLGACTRTAAPSEFDVVVPTPLAGPYGERTIRVPARTNWVRTGVYLRKGETATVEVIGGTWSSRPGATHGAGGRTPVSLMRGCPVGALAARIDLTYEEAALTCVNTGLATVTAHKAGPLFLGMNISTDLGETYESRTPLSGELTVRVTSNAGTFPAVSRDELGCFTPGAVASGHIELLGKHVSVIVPVAAYTRDQATALASLDTLDNIYLKELELRGAKPQGGQRIRFLRDDAINDIGYMLAGNPVRMVAGLVEGTDTQRILRASAPTTDVWGFAHELGHVFTFVGGTWVYMILNLESWPNIFTLYALEGLGRTAHQPNTGTYCDGRANYLAGGSYATFKSDPFVQLCFLMEFRTTHGFQIWKDFFGLMNLTTNDQVEYDGTDASVWRFTKNRLSFVTGQDLSAPFDRWRVPFR